MGTSFSWWCLDFFFFFLFAWLVQRLSLSLPILSSSASWKKRELGRILLLFSDLGFQLGDYVRSLTMKGGTLLAFAWFFYVCLGHSMMGQYAAAKKVFGLGGICF